MTASLPAPLERSLGGQSLIGRGTELDRLRSFVDSVAVGGCSAALTGEPGVGKTVLVGALIDIAEQAGMRVLSCTGSQLVRTGLARFLLAQPGLVHIGDLSRLHHTSRQDLGSVAEPLVLYNAILEVLATMASECPLLLIVDDLEELDDSTRDTLAFITRRPGMTPVGIMLVGTTDRGIPVDRHIPVGRLSSTDTRELITSLHPDLPPRVRTMLIDNAEGNPLVVLEQLKGHNAAHDTRAETSAFSKLLRDMPSRTRRALLIVALGRAENLRAVHAAGLEVAALDPAEERDLLRIHPGSLTATFTHPLIASLVISMASAEELRQAHLAHASTGSGILEVDALHLAEAASEPSESTAAMLEHAARLSVSRGDSGTATDLLTRAAHLSPSLTDRHRRLARAALLSTESLGERQLSATLLDESRAGHGHEVGDSLYTVVATAMQQLSTGAGSVRACATIRTVVEAGRHGWDASDAELIDAMNAWLILCWTAGRDDEWTAYFAALDRLDPVAPEPLRTVSVAFADTARATAWDRVGLNRMVASLSQDDDPAYILQTLTAALYFDQMATGVWAARQLLHSGRAAEGTLAHLRLIALIALHETERGRWREAEQLVDEALTSTPAGPNTPAVGMLLYVRALIAGLSGDTEGVSRTTRHLDDLADHLASHAFRRFGAYARAVAAAGRGQWEETYRQAATITTPGSLERYVSQAVRVSFELVVASSRTGRWGVARAQHRAMIDAELASHSPRLAMLTMAAGAVVDPGDRWDHDFGRALDIAGAGEWPFDHARVRFEYALRLRRAGRMLDAADQFDRAKSEFERLGSASWAAQATAERRSLRGAAPVPPRQTLTPQELAIAELAAQGYTNKEIGQRLYLSARTVSGHLYHVFPKLGISKRSSLRDALSKIEVPEERALA